MAEPTTFTLPAGTVCKRNGVPFMLQHATQIECAPGVWPLIKGEPPDEVVMSDEAPCKPLEPSQGAALLAFRNEAVQPEERERRSGCLFSGQGGSFAPISAMSNEGRCTQCISTIGGQALCR